MEGFIQKVKEAVQNELGDSYEITETKVTKVNDSVHPTLVVREKRSMIGATIYLDNYYKTETEDEEAIVSIARRIVDTINNCDKPAIDKDFIDSIVDFDKVKDNIIFRIINKDMNQEYLKEKVYIDYLDLALIFCVLIDSEEKTHSTTVVTERLFDKWDVDKNDLLDIARANTRRLFPAQISSLKSVIKELMSKNNTEIEEDRKMLETSKDIYVLTNIHRLNGASAILYEDMLSDFASEMETPELIILPSSVHETLLIADTVGNMIDRGFYEDLVKSVNDTEVSKEDILSYSVYRYNAKDNNISIME